MGHRNGLGQFGVQSQIVCHGIAKGFDVIDMFNAGTDVIVLGGIKGLCFVFQTAKCRCMNNAGIIPSERRADLPFPLIQGTLSGSHLFILRMRWEGCKFFQRVLHGFLSLLL